MIIVYAYIAVINIITFLIYGVDKLNAMRDHYRVPERVLLSLAAIGGSLGALAGMLLFHHKVRKPKFTVSVPLMLIAHIVIVVLILKHIS